MPPLHTGQLGRGQSPAWLELKFGALVHVSWTEESLPAQSQLLSPSMAWG